MYVLSTLLRMRIYPDPIIWLDPDPIFFYFSENVRQQVYTKIIKLCYLKINGFYSLFLFFKS